jgi:site-specific DNA-cytosine methylase
VRYLSLFSGIEAASVAWGPLGWKCAAVAEIEPFPCAVLREHYPSVPNLGDVTKITREVVRGLGKLDVVIFGSPCFTAGHLVSCVDGYKPIEDIRPGDLVRTHTGAVKPVVRVGGKVAPVGRISGVGLPSGIVCTHDHKFRSVEYSQQNTKRGGEYAREERCAEPSWSPAKEMVGKQWCSLTTCEALPHEPVSRKFDARQAMYLAGMYLGDGYIRSWPGREKKVVILCLNQAKLAILSEFLGYAPTATKSDGIFKVALCDTAFADWCLAQFGHLAAGKRLPLWVLSHEHRALLLQGYLDTDGTRLSNGYRVNSVSKALIFGVADLATACGYVPSVSFQRTPDTAVIEGRTVNQKDYWSLGIYPVENSRQSRIRHGYLLRKVQKFSPLSVEQRVYNIEVADDHSYVLNGIIVKNCQDLSVAGKREGIGGARSGLFFQAIEIVKWANEECGARFALWENVPGAFSSQSGRDFAEVVGALSGSGVEVPEHGWGSEGAAVGPNGLVEWSVLDAQWFGVAQRRRRVFALLDFGDWAGRPPILLEPQGLRGDSAPSREAGQSPAGTLASRTSGGGFPGTDEACEGYVTPCLTASRLQRIGESTGQDPVVATFQQSSMKGRGTIGWDDSGVAKPVKTQVDGQMVCFGGNNTAGPIDVATARSASASASGRLDFESETFVVFHHNAQAAQLPTTTDTSKTAALTCSQGAAVAFDTTQITSKTNRSNPQPGDPCHPLAAGAHPPALAQCATGDVFHTLRAEGFDASGDGTGRGGGGAVAFEPGVLRRCGGHHYEEVSDTLRKEPGDNAAAVAVAFKAPSGAHQVRRLTPIECERLQGFPDGFTQISWRGKPAELCPDGPRYKALGNSMCTNVMRWIGQAIERAVKSSTKGKAK